MLLFGPEGEYRRTVNFPEGGMRGASLFFPHGADGVVYASRGLSVASEGGRISMPTDIPIRRLPLNQEGRVAEEGEPAVVHRAWRPARDPPGSASVQGPGGDMRLPGPNLRAFEPQLHLAVLPDGRLAVADSSTYRIRILGPDGQEEGTVERPIPPEPVTDETRRAERERKLQELAEGGGPQFRITVDDGSGARTMDQDDLRPVLEERIQAMDFWPEIPRVRVGVISGS